MPTTPRIAGGVLTTSFCHKSCLTYYIKIHVIALYCMKGASMNATIVKKNAKQYDFSVTLEGEKVRWSCLADCPDLKLCTYLIWKREYCTPLMQQPNRQKKF